MEYKWDLEVILENMERYDREIKEDSLVREIEKEEESNKDLIEGSNATCLH